MVQWYSENVLFLSILDDSLYISTLFADKIALSARALILNRF